MILTYETLQTSADKATYASIIWMHGLGADGHDFINIVPSLRLPETVNIRFIFPHAPMRPISINNGMIMRGWYDIPQNFIEHEDEAGIEASTQQICELIQQERAHNIPAHRILLAGFSQGGAIALHTGLHHKERLGGIIALSTYLPLRNKAQQTALPHKLPIFMAHGTLDTMVPLHAAERSVNLLKQLGYPIDWLVYPMAHQVCQEEILALSKWLLKHLELEV